MDERYDWSEFYKTLCQHGPSLLLGIDEGLRETLEEIGNTTDMFWSTQLQDRLAEGVAAGSIRDGVLLAVNEWRNNVINTLDATFGITLASDVVTVNSASPVIDLLIMAASKS